MEGRYRKKSGAASEAARTLGHFGGLRGGPARDAKLSGARKSEIAAEGGRAKVAKSRTKKK